MGLLLFLSLMSTNSSQHTGPPATPSQSTIGMALTRMACVHWPALASSVTAAFVLKPSSSPSACSRTNGSKRPVPDAWRTVSLLPMYETSAPSPVVQSADVVLLVTSTEFGA